MAWCWSLPCSKSAAGLYHNTAVVFDADGSLAGKYRKMHIPDDPGFYEKFYFTGDLGLPPFKPRWANSAYWQDRKEYTQEEIDSAGFVFSLDRSRNGH